MGADVLRAVLFGIVLAVSADQADFVFLVYLTDSC